MFLSKTGLGSKSAHCKQVFHFLECEVGHLKVIGDVGSAWCLGRSQSLQDTQHPSHPLKGVAPHHVTARCPCNDFGGDCVGTAEYCVGGGKDASLCHLSGK